MALTLPTLSRNAMVDALTARINSGTSLGKLNIYDAGKAHLLVTCLFANPAFSAAVTGVGTAHTIADGTAVASYTAAVAEITDGAGSPADVITGLVVGAGSGDISLNSTTITSGDVVRITSMTITQPAS